MSDLQSADSLDSFWNSSDPWNYDTNPDDRLRVSKLLNSLPKKDYQRVLDIGCGNGFLTLNLPGKSVYGVDISKNAIAWAEKRKAQVTLPKDRECKFIAASLFDLLELDLGKFDLIVITGVLYPQYIGKSYSLVNEIINRLLNKDGILASCHIAEWLSWRFSLSSIHVDFYPYREYIHRLEYFKK